MPASQTFDRFMHWIDPGNWLGALVIAGLLLVAGFVLSWALRRLTLELIRHDRSEVIDQITLSFISHLCGLTIWVLLVTLYAHLVPGLHHLANAMLAGVGLMSVIIGFAAQQTLGNLIAGISLVLYRPFRRGDRLQIGAPTAEEFAVGTVEDISLGFTLLRMDDGSQIVVANGSMVQKTIIKLARATGKAGQEGGDGKT